MELKRRLAFQVVLRRGPHPRLVVQLGVAVTLVVVVLAKRQRQLEPLLYAAAYRIVVRLLAALVALEIAGGVVQPFL